MRVAWPLGAGIASAASLLLLVLGCAGENPARSEIEARRAAQAAPAEAASDWTCPMHPEVSEQGPGSCPKCGMPLVERRN